MKLFLKIISLYFILGFLSGQTTGKISGRITDSETNEPLIAANVLLEDANLGAASDVNGYYYIINVKPGIYNLIVDMIGYKRLTLENVRVSVNRTTAIDVSLDIMRILNLG